MIKAKKEPAVPITSIEFTILDNPTIKKSSVVSNELHGINNPQAYENHVPVILGVMDPRLGVTNNYSRCETCNLLSGECTGHPGHIELAEPVFHVGYVDYLKKILRIICLKCSKLLVNKNEKEISSMLKNKSNKMRFAEIYEICKNVSHCQTCGSPAPQIEVDKSTSIQIIAKHTINNIIQEETATNKMVEDSKQIETVLSPEICYNILRTVSDLDCSIMGLDPDKCRPEQMIIKYFHVPPVQIRPSTKIQSSGTKDKEDDLTHKIIDIIKTNEKLRAQKASTNQNPKYTNELFILLTYHIATFYSNNSTKMPKAEHRNGKEIISVSERLKGKEGRFRSNLEGKRVDYSGRTVLGPDKDIGIGEVGIPIKIAMNLTFPEKVTPLNIEYLTKLVENGADKYPGANIIERVDINPITGLPKQIFLKHSKKTVQLKYGDIVKRHLINGDIVLFNRQPTLHKPSMMAHKIHVLLDPNICTFRLNVSATKPYNADYDGDEMNIHVPQSIQTSIELSMIASVEKQIISVGNSKPIISCTQDALCGSYKMTKKDTIVDWKDASNLMMYTSRRNDHLVKKGVTYSGTDLFSLILPDGFNCTYDKVEIVNGRIIKGQINNKLIGTSGNNIIHKIWRELGPMRAANFIDDVQKLSVNWLQKSGYTFGPADIFITKECREKLFSAIETKRLEFNHLITEAENNPFSMDKTLFEKRITAELSSIRSNIIEPELSSVLPDSNHLKMCIQSGSKGSWINASEIIVCLTQQIVEGERIKMNYNGRSLPYFHKDDDSATARGFCVNSFMTGLNPAEFVFHTMGGREGLIETAIKTADTGYIQKKLIKALEDIYAAYDGTVRNAIGGIIQFAYGGNNINTEYQVGQELPLMKMDNDTLEKTFLFDTDIGKKYVKMMYDIRDTMRIIQSRVYVESITMLTSFYFPFDVKYHIGRNKEIKGKALDFSYVLDSIKEFLEKIYIVYMNKEEQTNLNSLKQKDNRDSKFLVSALIYDLLAPKRCVEEYKLSKEGFDNILASLEKDYYRALIPPGDSVGIITAQSIGEPATQMTLKTFHGAGTGKGVQGIPRLKEIIGVSKVLKTPIMQISLLPEYRENKKIANKIASYVRHTLISDIVKKIDIIYDPEIYKEKGIMEVDGVENLFYSHGSSNLACQSDISSSPWLFRLELKKEEMISKDVTLLDIKSAFCYHWSKRFEYAKKAKTKKTVFEKVSQCSILSNYDNSATPIIHIRTEMNKFDDSTLITLKDFILGFKLKGVADIADVKVVSDEKYISFDENGKDVHKEQNYIYTDGVNLKDIRYINGIEHDKIISNDIVQIYETYGIYAAKTALRRELKTVISGDGSAVAPQHISLLADVMTNTGSIMAINRFGINKLDTDPLSRASFEKSVEQVTLAAVFNEHDYMRSVSARIMAGKPILGGTGMCDFILDADAIISSEDNDDVDKKEVDVVDFTENTILSELMK